MFDNVFDINPQENDHNPKFYIQDFEPPKDHNQLFDLG
jgi:hypothetical protein